MTDIAAIRARHVLCTGRCFWFDFDYPDIHCEQCGNPWPCDTARVLEALDLECGVRSTALDELVEMQDRLDVARADAAELAEALRVLIKSDDDGYCRWCQQMLYVWDESLDQQGGYFDDHTRHSKDCAALAAHDALTVPRSVPQDIAQEVGDQAREHAPERA